MRPRWTALLTALALAGAAGGCGADDELSTDIPRTSPDLTIPTATTGVAPDPATTTPSTTDTTTAPPAAAQPATPAPAAPTTPPPPPPPASTTGGAGPPGGAQSTTGGARADPEFQNFCRDNPGAPPPC